MFLYENNKCPVCGELFVQGDDIVVCPECGTPHHRECYKSSGKCANKDKHGTDFIYERNNAKNEKLKITDSVQDLLLNADALNSASREFKNGQNADYPKTQSKAISSEAQSAAEKAQMNEAVIDDVKVSDVQTVVGINYPRFVKRFSKKRKLGWNWGAFFFGPYYFMFRKMYLESAVFLAIPLCVNMIINFLFSSAVEKLADISVELSKTALDAEKTSQFIKTALEAPENREVWKVVLLTLVISFVIRIVSAVIADLLYKKKVVKIIKTVDEKVNMGESFSLVGPFMGGDDLSQTEMRKMFLAKQGGVNIFLPFLLVMTVMFSYML